MDGWVTLRYFGQEGESLEKQMPIGHKHLRKPKSKIKGGGQDKKRSSRRLQSAGTDPSLGSISSGMGRTQRSKGSSGFSLSGSDLGSHNGGGPPSTTSSYQGSQS